MIFTTHPHIPASVEWVWEMAARKGKPMPYDWEKVGTRQHNKRFEHAWRVLHATDSIECYQALASDIFDRMAEGFSAVAIYPTTEADAIYEVAKVMVEFQDQWSEVTDGSLSSRACAIEAAYKAMTRPSSSKYYVVDAAEAAEWAHGVKSKVRIKERNQQIADIFAIC